MRITGMALMMWIAAAAAQGHEGQQIQPVDVQFGTTDRLLIMPLAQELAGRIFEKIGIQLEWKPGKRDGECLHKPIVIRLVSETPPELRPDVLGFALYNNNRITVFLDRVERFEYPAVVLAHVLVHEITHVLQGAGRHSETGLMKARWGRHDYSEMRHKPLPFTQEDLDLIYEGLAKRSGAARTHAGNTR